MTRASSAAGRGWCRLGGGGLGSLGMGMGMGMGWRVASELTRLL